MFSEPLREAYCSYGEYALAVVGFAVLSSRGSVANGSDTCVHDFLDCVHSGCGRTGGSVARVLEAGGRQRDLGESAGLCTSRVEDGREELFECNLGGADVDVDVKCSVSDLGGTSRKCVGTTSLCEPFGLSGSVNNESEPVLGVTCQNHVESKTQRNRRWRVERKEKKKKRQSMNLDWRQRPSPSTSSNIDSIFPVSEEDAALKTSLKAKWKIQNELAVEKARRELEVLKVSDIEQEVKQYRTKVSAATERNMVSIEKTHARLRQTGNLPEERGGGFAETVVSGVPGLESGSGTISPDSSASMAEFRACQKALLDAERENAEYKRKIKIASEKYGFPLEQVDFLDKEVWTDTQTNQDILDEIYPNGYGKDTSLFEDGKFRAIGV